MVFDGINFVARPNTSFRAIVVEKNCKKYVEFPRRAGPLLVAK